MKQTPVEWLVEQTRKPEWHSLIRGEIIEQAKEIENQQKGYSEEEIRNMLIDMSNYIKTKELRDYSDTNFNEWVRRRDWFISFLFEQFKNK